MKITAFGLNSWWGYLLSIGIYCICLSSSAGADEVPFDQPRPGCVNGFSVGDGTKALPAPSAKVIELAKWSAQNAGKPRKQKFEPENKKPPQVVAHNPKAAVVSAEDFMSLGALARGNVSLQKHLLAMVSHEAQTLDQDLRSDGIIGFAVTLDIIQLKKFLMYGVISPRSFEKQITLKPIYRDSIEIQNAGESTATLIFDTKAVTPISKRDQSGDYHQEVLTVWSLRSMVVESGYRRNKAHEVLFH